MEPATIGSNVDVVVATFAGRARGGRRGRRGGDALDLNRRIAGGSGGWRLVADG